MKFIETGFGVSFRFSSNEHGQLKNEIRNSLISDGEISRSGEKTSESASNGQQQLDLKRCGV